MAANPSRSESDSENDVDYVPPNADEDSSSSESEPESKRARVESPKMSTEEEEARKKALWTSFQASVNEMAPTLTSRMVKVQKRYRFAGEEVTEVIEVPEDSPEAKEWPTWHPADALQAPAASVSSVAENPISTPPEETGTTQLLPAPATPTPPNGRRPGPRRPKTQLVELPGRGTQKAKKLTTLDKSVMDWKAHVRSSGDIGLQDELEANRRGGGYLGKVEFLQRVEERKDAAFEAAKGNKRRRT